MSATNALILYYLGIMPASHWERRKFLDRLEDEVPEVERLGLGIGMEPGRGTYTR